jgi:hypothetical protein
MPHVEVRFRREAKVAKKGKRSRQSYLLPWARGLERDYGQIYGR